jgi:hypothetical protein
MAGVVLITSGGALLGTAVAASAAATLSFTPTTPIGPPPDSLTVTVTGSGFKKSTEGGLFECSNVTPQPTIDVMMPTLGGSVDLGQVPVSCSSAQELKTNATGKFPKNTQFVLGSGVLGPPATGTDSAGTDATTDAAAYPCPPTSAQSSAACELLYIDKAAESASAPVSFSFQTTTTTTSTTSPSSCEKKSNSVTMKNPNPPGNTATVTVNPATCLVGGDSVTVTASNLVPNTLGSILECSTAGSNGIYADTPTTVSGIVSQGTMKVSALVGVPDKSGTLSIQLSSGPNATLNYTGVTVNGSDATFTGLTLGSGSGTLKTSAIVSTGQPYVVYLANAIPVSCTAVKTFTTAGDGSIPPNFQAFSIVQGTTGPPCTPAVGCTTDSDGNDPATDAAKFPCPPTAAQIAAGVGCVIALGDVGAAGAGGGDKVPVPIVFLAGGVPHAPTTTVPTAATAAPATAATSAAASSGTLAFTGPGPGLWALSISGLALIVAGGVLLVVVDAPRRLLLAITRRRDRSGD